MLKLTRKEKLLNFISSLYIPSGKREEKARLMRIVLENEYRAIEESDSGKMFRDCLIIETKGRGVYETFHGFKVCRVDIGAVGPTMADIAIFYDSTIATPQRVARGNIKINLPNE